MDASQTTPKGMQTMGGNTGMDGREVCWELEPGVPIHFQCPIPNVSTPLTISMPSWGNGRSDLLLTILGNLSVCEAC